jgi:hypothetical protein
MTIRPSLARKLILLSIFAFVAVGTAYAAIGKRGNVTVRQTAPTAYHTTYEAQRVVYHLTEAPSVLHVNYTRWVGSMEGHFKAAGDGGLDLVAVLNGDGVDFLAVAKEDAALADRIDTLRLKGARFLVSRETLVARGIDWDKDLFGVAPEDIVENGVAEITSLQQQGYAYLRP